MNAYDQWLAADWVQHYTRPQGAATGANPFQPGGALYTRIVTPSTLVDAKIRVDTKFRSLLDDAKNCAALTPGERSSLQADFQSWRRLFCDNTNGACATAPTPSWLTVGLGGKMDDVETWEKRIFDWQKKLQTKCQLSAPVSQPPNSPDGKDSDTSTMIKYIAVAVGLVAVAYTLGPTARRLGEK